MDLSEYVGRVAADASVVCELKELLIPAPKDPSCGRITLSVSAGVLGITDHSHKLADGAMRRILENPSMCLPQHLASLRSWLLRSM